MPIRILDAAVVGRIAAGEVVERPSSVVKELVENSLDAGATSVTVEIRGGGIDYLRVTDNGCGIEPGQVRMAFENHATSKLQRAEQLDDIRTLGFRGEALPSIAAVSRVEMTTRARGMEVGSRLTMEGGSKLKLSEAGCPEGTTLIMRDLFYNIPVRRAFLKKPSYEGGLVSDTLSRLLLGNPGVSMRMVNGGNTLFHSFGDGKLRHAVFAVYGRETAEKMVEIDASEGGTHIYGLIGVGELAKATRAHQMFFINGRSVRCPLLTRALEMVCRSRVTIGMFPMCVLNLVIAPNNVDVNVHPNKLEVRFRDEDFMRTVCERLLATAFAGERVLEIARETSERPKVNRTAEIRELPLKAAPEKAAPLKTMPEPSVPDKTAAESKPQMPPLPGPAGAAHAQPEQTRLTLETASGARMLREDARLPVGFGPIKTVDCPGSAANANMRSGTSGAEAQPASRDGETAKTATGEPGQVTPGLRQSVEVEAEAGRKPVQPTAKAEPAKEIPPFRVIGVAFKTYILVESGDALLLIDQHAAHERLQYERFMARAEAGMASQQLLAPIVIRLSAKEMALIRENQQNLEAAGYRVEPFGENDVRVTAVPFVLGKAELRPLFLEMIQSLGELRAATVDARRSEIMQMACKSAVKAGDTLTESEIAVLIQNMMETGAPPTCPHGRPVVKTMTRRDLEKLFKRIQ